MEICAEPARLLFAVADDLCKLVVPKGGGGVCGTFLKSSHLRLPNGVETSPVVHQGLN